MSAARGVDDDSVPRLARGVKLRFDAARDRWSLLGPERVFVPDEIALAVLQKVDGASSIGVICDTLAREFGAPRDVVGPDVLELLGSLVDKGMIAI